MTKMQLPRIENPSMRPLGHDPLPFEPEDKNSTPSRPSEHIVTKTSASCADRDLVTFIRRFIGSSLASGDVTITKAAKAADINARTLQRRLGAVGLTYSQVVDEVRLGTAIRLLVRPEMSLSEIALTLGYSDPGHFTRAFKRWTGETPTVFRKRLRQGRRR